VATGTPGASLPSSDSGLPVSRLSVGNVALELFASDLDFCKLFSTPLKCQSNPVTRLLKLAGAPVACKKSQTHVPVMWPLQTSPLPMWLAWPP
jgi:hypothetical protein